ncbi:cysteine--tRNA ligase [Cochlodiniinecator piscidefendens]|uniref:cysteine--tRNA ligase n=1 Tax=Cochlodiniinecator piscidefendens TaxID=2715756 RepID=UPI00140A24EF|nr:cysteine--tRNA ligase [Cochlodiniinecator piscidefendens]
MVEIKLHNSKTRKKEVFTPINSDNVRMYVCGPTVYDRAHLGNARPVVVFDVLNRLLRHVYGEDHVTYVRNFTDVDDKINATAKARKDAGAEGTMEELIAARSDETIKWYLEDMEELGAREPDHMPRATQYIEQMIAMSQDLIDKGHAYAAEGHVLFAVDSYKKYGALSGRSVDDMIAGARVEVAPYKRNPMDFVLWKPSDENTPGWDSPWGKGRPGWHIECSAMAFELLGETFDIHGGGNDLQFPHHENEIAQSCCAHGEDTFAQYWLHNEMLQVEGKKMSKSLGNFFTVRDLLDQGTTGEVIRYVFLQTHYRKPMNWTELKADQATKHLSNYYRLLADLGRTYWEDETRSGIVADEFVSALADDINGSLALHHLHDLAKEARSKRNFPEKVKPLLERLHGALVLLGFNPAKSEALWFFIETDEKDLLGTNETGPNIGVFGWVGISEIEKGVLFRVGRKWWELRTQGQYNLADELRDEILSLGLMLEATKNGAQVKAPKPVSMEKLEPLL